MAPVERRAQRPLAVGQVARAADEQVERLVEPLAIASGGRSFERAAASSIASGSPSSRAQICRDAAALPSSSSKPGRRRAARAANSRTASFAASASKLGAASPGGASGGTGYSCSPRGASGARLVASTSSRGAAASSSADELDVRHELLEVVEHEQQRRLAELLGERLADRRPAFGDPERLRDRGAEQRRIPYRGEVDEDRAVAQLRPELRGDREREPRLARAARARSA